MTDYDEGETMEALRRERHEGRMQVDPDYRKAYTRRITTIVALFAVPILVALGIIIAVLVSNGVQQAQHDKAIECQQFGFGTTGYYVCMGD